MTESLQITQEGHANSETLGANIYGIGLIVLNVKGLMARVSEVDFLGRHADRHPS